MQRVPDAARIKQRDMRGLRDTGGRVALAILDCLKPVVAAINGPAIGVGATMTLAMDMRIAARSSRFGFVFGKIGIVPDACASWFLPRIVGLPKALQWTLGGEPIQPDAALAGGLVDEIAEDGDALARAMHAALWGASKAKIIAEIQPSAAALSNKNSTAQTALAAAYWAFSTTDSFRDAVLRAANVGGNSDVVASVCGQLAGAHYGVGAIPAAWRNGLIQKELIESCADRLLAHSLVSLGA